MIPLWATARTLAAAAAAFALASLLAGCPTQAGGSPPITPTGSTVTGCSPPGTNPKFIAIVGQGITSSVETDTAGAASFNPATQSYCTSPDGKSPPDNAQVMLQSMADAWLDWNCPVGVYEACTSDSHTKYYPNDLIDALAHAGGYVLPFSYLGAQMSGTQDHPSFSLTPYSSNDVATSNPTMYAITSDDGTPARQEPAVLDAEIASIHKVFPRTPILVIAHSNGGLIAEQWWQNYAATNSEGVTHVFSLDSPVNGIATGNVFAVLGVAGPVQHVVGEAYTKLWADKNQNDPYVLKLDQQVPIYTPVGSYGDPLYDMADAFSDVNHIDINQPGAGIISQVFIDPRCLTTGVLGTGFNELYDVRDNACQPTGPDFASPCAAHWYTGLDYVPKRYTYPDYGFVLDTRWQHSVVKNCQPLISEIMKYVPATAPATSSPSPSPTPQCTAFSSACPDGPKSGSPSISTPSAAPSSTATPGYATPQDAVAGFYQGELAGNWAAVCSYVVPSAQSLCLAGTSGQGAATGSITVDRAVIQGTEALVGVTGSICAPSTPCAANTDPSLGMPSSASEFQALYQAAVASGSSGGGTNMSPMPCTQVGGKWYVAFG